MKKNLMLMSMLLCSLFMITGCGNDSDENNFGVDLKDDNVLACTNLSYNYISGVNSNILENHIFLVEYDENKTDILSVKEVYTADISKKDEKNDSQKVEELKEYIKSRFCEQRKTYITPSDYEGEAATCDITFENEVITATLTYPKEIVKYAVEKGKFGSLEEVKTQLEDGEFSAAKNNYFTCDKNYDKSTLINKEIKATLTLKYFENVEYKGNLYHLAAEFNMYNRFAEEVFEEYKTDTRNRITLKPIDEEVGYVEGDYTLTYNCVADSEETCNKITDFVIDAFVERAKDFKVNVTKK